MNQIQFWLGKEGGKEKGERGIGKGKGGRVKGRPVIEEGGICSMDHEAEGGKRPCPTLWGRVVSAEWRKKSRKNCNLITACTVVQAVI